jgi:hypothetical protein
MTDTPSPFDKILHMRAAMFGLVNPTPPLYTDVVVVGKETATREPRKAPEIIPTYMPRKDKP